MSSGLELGWWGRFLTMHKKNGQREITAENEWAKRDNC